MWCGSTSARETRSFIKYYGIPGEAAGRRYGAEMIKDILAVDPKQQPNDGAAG
jgi:hypothetical protein